jgi:hypothetical protein
LDFLADFDDKIEAHLEGVVEVAPWNLNLTSKTSARMP